MWMRAVWVSDYEVKVLKGTFVTLVIPFSFVLTKWELNVVILWQVDLDFFV